MKERSYYEEHASVDERHEVYEGQLCCTKSSGGATKELQGSYEYNENSRAATKDTKCTKSRRGATKDTLSVDERHEVYEEQLCCTKSSRAATKNTRSVDEGQLCCTKSSGAATNITKTAELYEALYL